MEAYAFWGPVRVIGKDDGEANGTAEAAPRNAFRPRCSGHGRFGVGRAVVGIHTCAGGRVDGRVRVVEGL